MTLWLLRAKHTSEKTKHKHNVETEAAAKAEALASRVHGENGDRLNRKPQPTEYAYACPDTRRELYLMQHF